MARFKVIKVGNTFDVAELAKKPKVGRQPSPRDVELDRLLHEVAAGAKSQVWPLVVPDGEKVATWRLAVNRAIARTELPVYVGVNQAVYPNTLLLSLTNIGRKKK